MIKIQIDLAEASTAELGAFYEIPGMKEAIGTLNTRGRELNVMLTLSGAEAAVASLMNAIGAKLPAHIDYDEFHKIDTTAPSAIGMFTPGQPAPIYAAGVLVHQSTD